MIKYLEEKNFIVNELNNAYNLYLNRNFVISSKGEFDLVTNADKGIEEYIKTKIKEEYPNDLFYGEESLKEFDKEKRVWVLDPIDGTCNFARNMEIFGSQLALIDKNELVMSIIIKPNTKEIFYAIKGHGAYLNGKRIYANKNNPLNKCLCSYGDYSHRNKNYQLRQIKSIETIIEYIQKVRMFGSAAVDFSNVAVGRIDSTIIMTDNLWDLLPGILLTKEAGAIITNLDGNEYKFGDFGVVSSANEKLHRLLIDSLNN